MVIKDAPVAAQKAISGLGVEGLRPCLGKIAPTTPLHRDPSAPSSAPFFPTKGLLCFESLKFPIQAERT